MVGVEEEECHTELGSDMNGFLSHVDLAGLSQVRGRRMTLEKSVSKEKCRLRPQEHRGGVLLC